LIKNALPQYAKEVGRHLSAGQILRKEVAHVFARLQGNEEDMEVERSHMGTAVGFR